MEELDRYDASDSDLDENVVSAYIICLPPRDGDDTDKDDAASDEDVQTNNPRFLGRGVQCHLRLSFTGLMEMLSKHSLTKVHRVRTKGFASLLTC